ncbi:MAG: EAL domain-containing protein, partial [Microvirga sp.]
TTITNHRKDGTSFINELTISPVQSATGVTTHFVGTLSDITERSRLNETLRLALRAGHMVAWEHDLRTDFVTRSDNARELVGIGSGTLSDFLARVHPDDQPVRARLVEDVDRDGVGTCEFRCILPGGEIMWFGCRAEKVGPDRIAGVSYDITTRKAAEDDLWRAANRDFMTGLPNRSLFQQSLEQAVGQARRNGTSISLLLIDLDNFKDINDTLGHDAGDALLAELATRLDVLQKDGDMVARIGGDEFAVLVVAPVSFETVIRLAETVKERVRMPFVFGGRTFVTRASVGVAGFPSDAVSPAELMKAADIALYQAKAQGRSRIVAYASSMRLEIEARVALAAEIRDAISRDQIVPYYQPKVSLLTGRVTGFEALARWQHPDKGLLTPQYFGTIFSDHNLAAAIGRCVLTQVARDIRRWLDDGLDPGRGAINLSSAEFNNPRLATDLLAVLDHWRVPVENFEVEVTETVLLGRETENVAAILTQFHQRGVQIALDDFGTGYASLTHLKRFPVDHIKIDQSFIRDMEADASNDAIVAAVIGLCRSLNLQVTAEGIETEGQSRRLRELGCTNAQGYFYAKPMSGARVAGFLSTWMSDLHGRPLPSPWIHPSSG